MKIYKSFNKKFITDDIINKTYNVEKLWDIIQEIPKNEKYIQLKKELLNNTTNTTKEDIIKSLFNLIKNLYSNSLFSDKKNQYKTFCQDIQNTTKILGFENESSSKKFYNETLKKARYDNKDIIIKIMKRIIKQDITNFFETKAILNVPDTDKNLSQEIDSLNKEISKLKNEKDSINAKFLTQIEGYKRDNQNLQTELIKTKEKLEIKDDKYEMLRINYDTSRNKNFELMEKIQRFTEQELLNNKKEK